MVAHRKQTLADAGLEPMTFGLQALRATDPHILRVGTIAREKNYFNKLPRMANYQRFSENKLSRIGNLLVKKKSYTGSDGV